jgi:hypothetical protein
MHLFQFSPLSVTIGIAVIILSVFIQFHFPFRYQYLSYLFRRNPALVKRLLQRSYRKNHTIIGLLDKSTKELLDGNYESTQKYITAGLQLTKKSQTAENQLAALFLYSNLSWTLYYQGKFRESLQIALQVYEQNQLPNILALICCNYARIGNLHQAVETHSELSTLNGVSSLVLLPCRAEIEAAKGNPEAAIHLLYQVKKQHQDGTAYFILQEIDNRIVQLKKPA